MQSLTAPNGMTVRMYNSNDPTMVVPATLINSYSILTIPAYYRAMRFLSENLASFPRAVHKDAAEMDVAHPLDSILKGRPNTYQTATVFWRTFFFSAAHTNNGFARIDRAGNRPVALHNLTDGDVMPFRLDIDDGRGIQQYYYVRSTKTILFGDDVLHLPGMTLDGMAGIDPVQLHADSFQRAKTIDKYTTRFLMKGTVLKGSVEIPGSMDDKQFNEFRNRLRSMFRGAEAEDDVIILSDAAKLNNATMSSVDAQLIEQAAYSTKQISQITGVHPHYLFDDREGKYNANGEIAGIDVVRYTFRPWLDLIEPELSAKLLTTAEAKAGLTIHLNADALTRGDSKTTTETLVAQTNAGLRQPNEARKVLGLPPDSDPKSSTLRIVGDTNPKGLPNTPPPKNAALPGPRWSTSQTGQWEELEADSMELDGECDDDSRFSVNLHQGGAIGTAVAAAYFPPGTTIDTNTAAGHHAFAVDSHEPHAHPNWTVPILRQTAGGQLPGNPSKINLGHVARMAAGSKVMGMEPVVSVSKPAAALTPTLAPYAALRPIIDAACARVEAKTVKAFQNAASKPESDRTIWANVFAEDQAAYARVAMGPINDVLIGMGATPIDAARLGERYGAQIRKRAATGNAETLAELLDKESPKNVA